MARPDREAMHKALLSIKKGNWKQAADIVAQTRDPLAAEIYYWLYYTKEVGPVQFSRISAFVRQNPDWPGKATLQLAAEKAMPSDLPSDEVVRWFGKNAPQTPDGMDRYIRALLNGGESDRAKEVLRPWWGKTLLTREQQKYFVGTYSSLLDKKSNVLRLDTLLRNDQYTNARALALWMANGYPALAEARIVLAEGKGGVDGAVSRVPEHLRADPGLLLERLRWRRMKGDDYGAMEILHGMPPLNEISNPQAWWNEWQIIARRLIENKQYESAFLLLEKHPYKEGVPFAEAEFMAGWLALVHLKKPWQAFEHFEALYAGTGTSLSRSRGAYWAGRASDALGHGDIARKWYQTAARYQTTFYGQLALTVLDDGSKPPQQVAPVVPVEDEVRFKTRDMSQAARLLNAAGLEKESIVFIRALADAARTPGDYKLTAELASDLEYPHIAVRIAKAALEKGVYLPDQSYPTILSLVKDVDTEWALVHGTIRQESAFDHKALSSAGAAGLMQLMPRTAKEAARKQRLSYSPGWLVSKPSYNLKLGSYHMNQMIDRFDGSYPLALAAYNAGASRVDKWLKEFGDPRKGEIDMIDWIEAIPFEETRNYVQRVLENVYVYRLKLGDIQKLAPPPIHVAMAQQGRSRSGIEPR